MTIKDAILSMLAAGPLSAHAIQAEHGPTTMTVLRELRAEGKVKGINRLKQRAWALPKWKPAKVKPKPMRLMEAINSAPRTAEELAELRGIGLRRVKAAMTKLRRKGLVSQLSIGGVLRYVRAGYVLPMEDLIKEVAGRSYEEGDCLIWRDGAKQDCGNPIMRHAGRSQRVQRVLWLARGKSLAEDQRIIMTCENKLCVAEHHMKRVSRDVPFKLAAEKGAWSGVARAAKLAKTHRAMRGIFSDQDILDIRESSESQSVLAERYGCNKSSIGQIMRGDTYKTYTSPFAGLGAR